MNLAIEDLLRHDTGESIPCDQEPKTHKIANSGWVYRVKVNKDGSTERFKSRFVVRGYFQVKA